MTEMPERPLYRVTFVNQGHRYEIYAHSVGASGIFGFVEISAFSFGDADSLVIDPSQEQLRREFSQIKRTHIPLQNILRIDEVMQQGTAKISSLPTSHAEQTSTLNIVPFPPATE